MNGFFCFCMITESDFVEKVAGLYKKDVAKVIELRKEQIKKSP